MYVQLVRRRRPYHTMYIRLAPYTIWRPKPAQAEVRVKFGELAREAGRLGPDRILRLAKSMGYDVDWSRKLVYDPKLKRWLPCVAWYIRLKFTGYRSRQPRSPRRPKWLELLERLYTREIVSRVVEIAEKLKSKPMFSATVPP